jgi:hypothetical protein
VRFIGPDGYGVPWSDNNNYNNMLFPKLGFRNKSALQQLLICERVIASLKRAAQPHQSKLRFSKAATLVADARESLERMDVLKAELKAETRRRNELLRKAREQVTWAQAGHASLVGRDKLQLQAAGIDMEGLGRRRVGLPAKVANVRTVPATHSTDITLRWERSVRRCLFQVEARRDDEPNTEWRTLHQGFKIKCVISGLKSGGLYWFRVRASNAHGAGPWSNPVSARVR